LHASSFLTLSLPLVHPKSPSPADPPCSPSFRVAFLIVMIACHKRIVGPSLSVRKMNSDFSPLRCLFLALPHFPMRQNRAFLRDVRAISLFWLWSSLTNEKHTLNPLFYAPLLAPVLPCRFVFWRSKTDCLYAQSSFFPIPTHHSVPTPLLLIWSRPKMQELVGVPPRFFATLPPAGIPLISPS